MSTVGDAIDAKVTKYIQLYHTFKANTAFQKEARAFATHDITLAIYINEEALKEVQAYIDEQERGET